MADLPLKPAFAQNPILTDLSPAHNATNVPATVSPAFGSDHATSNGKVTLGGVKVFNQQREEQMRNGAGGTISVAGGYNKPNGGPSDGSGGVAPTTILSSTVGASGGSTDTTLIPMTATFSASVTAFTLSGVSVTNGTVGSLTGSLTGSGTTYTFYVTSTAPGLVTVRLVAGAARDAAGNNSLASTPFTITYAPGPAISSFTPTSGPVGTSVALTGTNLTGATAVTFSGSSGNVVSVGFSVAGATSITGIMVPAGAVTGPLTVTTPNGTSVASSFSFTVTPALSGFVLSASSLSPIFSGGTDQLHADRARHDNLDHRDPNQCPDAGRHHHRQ